MYVKYVENQRESCCSVEATSVKKMVAVRGQLAVAVPDAGFLGQASENRFTAEALGSI